MIAHSYALATATRSLIFELTAGAAKSIKFTRQHSTATLSDFLTELTTFIMHPEQRREHIVTLTEKSYLSDAKPLCDLADPAACEPCQGLRLLDTQIIVMRVQLADIEKERRKLHTRMNIHHDRLIHRFPPEIAARIFQMCLPSNFMEKDLHSKTSEYRPAAPLILAAVCRQWRTIAFSAPRLWKDVPMHLQTSNSRSLPLLAKEWIERSGQLPLSISLSVDLAQPLSTSLIGRTISVLNEYSGRWLHLKYQGPSSSLSQFSSSISGVPQLKTLRIKTLPTTNVSNFNLGTFMTSSLDLLELTAICLRSVDVDLDSLTRLTLHALRIEDCLEALHKAPNLTHCTLYQVLWSSSFVPSQEAHSQVHHKIQYLELCGADFKYVLKELVCPVLRDCKIHAQGERVDMATLSTFFIQSGSGLERLHLSNASLHREDVDNLFKSVPKLLHLHIPLSYTYDDAFPRAFLLRLADVTILPNQGLVIPMHFENLHTLVLETSYRVDWNLLIGSLLATSSKERLRPSLNDVKIVAWPGIPRPWSKDRAISDVILPKLLNVKERGVNLRVQIGKERMDWIQKSIDHWRQLSIS